MRASELDFELPEELIAQEPPAERDGARLAYFDRDRGTVEHHRVVELPRLLKPSLFVVNDTKVIPARLYARKPTGGRVELLLVEPLGENREPRTERWLALARGTKSLRPGLVLEIDGGLLVATIRALREGGEIELELTVARDALRDAPSLDVHDAIAKVGQIPLPPYIRRDVDDADSVRYQTIFAAHEGSVAAPTAGLHVSPRMLSELGQRGHAIARVTLHVGPGTFAPLRADDLDEHRMHSERYEVPVETALAIQTAKSQGRPVVAVGTTVCRTLESVVDEAGVVRAGRGQTSIFIRPGHTFRAIDVLFTNFHLPRSTLLALVMAFGGTEAVRRAYETCVAERYRFFSYGDAMLLASRTRTAP